MNQIGRENEHFVRLRIRPRHDDATIGSRHGRHGVLEALNARTTYRSFDLTLGPERTDGDKGIFLTREGEYRVLKVTPSGREVLRGQQTPRLLKPATGGKSSATSVARRKFTEGMDAGLFDALRQLRRRL